LRSRRDDRGTSDGDSDRHVVENARVNLAYKYFLGLAVDDEVPDDTTMSYFRAHRLGEEKFKAVFQNEDRVLWPNQFVNIRLLLEIKQNAITVPLAAIQRGNQGTFAYVVKPDNTVEPRVVKVGVTEGNLASIESGLQPGELVVTDGQDKLQPGAKVEVQRGNRSGAPPPKANGAAGS
jgi:hypothetical protein